MQVSPRTKLEKKAHGFLDAFFATHKAGSGSVQGQAIFKNGISIIQMTDSNNNMFICNITEEISYRDFCTKMHLAFPYLRPSN